MSILRVDLLFGMSCDFDLLNFPLPSPLRFLDTWRHTDIPPYTCVDKTGQDRRCTMSVEILKNYDPFTRERLALPYALITFANKIKKFTIVLCARDDIMLPADDVILNCRGRRHRNCTIIICVQSTLERCNIRVVTK